MPDHDPLSKLTKAEQDFIKNTVSKWPRTDVLKKLKRDVQIAVEIELATIPIYLFGYYSIHRVKRSGEHLKKTELFANEAGGVIMSVAVEEMLHMSLSSNIYYALFGEPPQLYRKSPGTYPTPLPYHNPVGPPGPKGPKDADVLIPLSKFSYEQLWHFLQIEYPEEPKNGKFPAPKDQDWDTIGQFYSYIRCLVSAPQLTEEDFQKGDAKYQIQPYNYSPNNVDTVHPESKFDPWLPPGKKKSAADVADFSNKPDSTAGPTQLVTVSCRKHALEAIDTICDQGEGFPTHRGPKATDDPSKQELSHYSKFLKLQSQLAQYDPKAEGIPQHNPTPPPKSNRPINEKELAEVVFNFPDNPTSAGYYVTYLESPGYTDFRPLSDLCNGVYQYMLILTETVFKIPGPENGLPEQEQQQKLFFNKAMHNSMIWILDKLAQVMRGFELGDGHVLAPTFENIDLGPRKDSFQNLKNLCNATKDKPYYSDIGYLVDRIENTIPDVSTYWTPPPGPGDPGEPVPKKYPYAKAPKFPTTIGAQPEGLPLHSCMGLNSCKGSDRFGVNGPADGPTPGNPNECAGQGYCSTTADHTCHVKNDCKNQGGCGLYGTAEELDNPGNNACKSLGSCATPINAERFSTNGPNQKKSVWVRAREVFEKEVYPKLQPQLKAAGVDAPATLGSVPKLFADTGPTYLWITDDNQARGNATACGQSGMSGAGGCV